MFTAEIMLGETSGGGAIGAGLRDARRGPRRSVNIPANFAATGLRSLCKITDLSDAGARISTYVPLEPRAIVMIALPGVAVKAARVIWADDFNAGCAFDEPLTVGELDDLVARFGFTPALPEVAIFRH